MGVGGGDGVRGGDDGRGGGGVVNSNFRQHSPFSGKTSVQLFLSFLRALLIYY